MAEYLCQCVICLNEYDRVYMLKFCEEEHTILCQECYIKLKYRYLYDHSSIVCPICRRTNMKDERLKSVHLVCYHENGNKSMEFNSYNGAYHGLYTSYKEDGSIKCQYEYDRGHIVRKMIRKKDSRK